MKHAKEDVVSMEPSELDTLQAHNKNLQKTNTDLQAQVAYMGKQLEASKLEGLIITKASKEIMGGASSLLTLLERRK